MTTRASQVVAEVLVAVTSTATPRASQTIAEILVAGGVTPRASQIAAELLIQLASGGGGGLPHRVSQIVAEILIWTQHLTTPPIFPTLIGLAIRS